MSSRTMSLFYSMAASPLTRWVALPALCAAGLAIVSAQTTPSLPPTVSLSPEPLYAKGARAKPTLTLALSVEFPTVGAQYVSTPNTSDDASYSPDTKYIGYFDTESCYLYNRSSGDVSQRYFYRNGAATNRTCGGTGFSGNFMNWATSSAVDVLRLGLTGGDRVIDTSTLTVLQRAVLPGNSANNNTNFWNGTNFPSKQITSAQAAGAVPSALLPSGFTGTLYVANCLNRVHFGTAKAGNCGSPGNNGNLGLDVAATGSVPTTGMYSGTLPSGFTEFGSETFPGPGPSYTVTGTQEIAYGSGSTWAIITQTGGTVACSNSSWATYGVPGLASSGDPTPAVAKKCLWRSASGSTGSTGAVTGLTADKFFYSRVRVCESTSGVLTDPRTNLCLRYPNGQYKPVGNLQKYSDRVRVAAFGYLNDNNDSTQRYGGVLRAPMKYVGPRAYDANFSLISGTNAAQEWDPETGILATNPDGATAPNSGADSNRPNQPISGVINYLNQFGRTGTFGQYKRRDPVGELYYESLRYLQGLPPTLVGTSTATNAMHGIDNTLRDGFPVVYADYPAYTDPHPASNGTTDYSCFKNNIVGIGDVNANSDKYLPGNDLTGNGDIARTANDALNEPDFKAWTKVVGGFESNNAVSYADGKSVSGVANRTTSNPNTPANTARWGMESQTFSGGATYYVAGAAYWANTHDIRGTLWTDQPTKQRPGMRVTTYWLDVNEFGQQTNPAVRRASNQFYLSAKYGGFKDVTGTGDPFKKLDASGSVVTDTTNVNWQRQTSDTNLQEAKNYFLSSSAETVLAALDEIFANVASEANSIAGGAISTSRVTSSGGLIYQAQFDPADWSGDLVAYSLALSTDGTQIQIGSATSSVWTNSAGQSVGAAGKLDDTAPGSRNIYVGFNSSATTPVFDSSAFTWAAVDDSVKSALFTSPETADVQGQNRLNYLRGDRTLEAGGTAGGNFRKRGSRLGDIVNSGIAYVAGPTQTISDSSYASFYSSTLSRVPTLYVGANDGMLHAFNATTGEELFAYIPSWVVPNLMTLTSTNYSHRSYVDATPVVNEANLGSTSSADWRTVLVGGSGGGGQGVYALDVTDPTAFASSSAGNSSILWEFTDKHDVDMGNVIGTPQILKLNVAAGSSTPDYRYFAVVASGVNNHAADGQASTTGQPALFFLRLDKPKSTAWQLGANYYKVKFPVITTDSSLPSGLANFTVRLGIAREVSYLYAGDLQGNLWKLDFRTTSADSWSLDNLSFFKNSGSAIPMFVATDGATTPNRQPITMPPALTFGPNRGIIVSFGTGRYLSAADNSAPFRVQTMYSVFDNNSATPDSTSSPTAAISGRGRLQAGTVTSTSITFSGFAWGRPSADNDTTSRAGWYFDFYNSGTTSTVTGTGERQISGLGVLAGRLIFGSVIPAVTSCDNGTGNLYVIDTLSGNGSATVSDVGILGEPFLTRVGYSTLFNSDPTGSRKETTRYQIIKQGSSGLGTQASQTIHNTVGRLSWREISNYQDVRNAN
jgi:type IV pilus assembly protein PilY1